MTSVGIEAFGFNDSVDGRLADGVSDRPACVVLCQARDGHGGILAGADADKSRIQQGFHWPPEARLPSGTEPVRRIPVSLLWEALLSNRGRGIRFGMFEPEDLLCAHVDAVCPPEEGVRRVLAIPNTLGMAAQERLLRAFGSHRKDVTLLWRPVAAVLGWLERLPSGSITRPGWVGVCYLGADGLEFTRLELDLSRPGFAIPVRSRPGRKNEPRFDGFDLAKSCALRSFPKLQGGEPAHLWQGLLRFPDAWDLVRRLPPRETPALWSHGGSWDLDLGRRLVPTSFEYGCLSPPSPRCIDRKPFALAGGGGNAPVDGHFPSRDSRDGNSSPRWGERLGGLAEAAFGKPETSDCLGIIVCGKLSPALGSPPSWIEGLKQAYGLKSISNKPRIRRVSLPCEDLVSLGARLYGERLDFNAAAAPEDQKPTYFDTLPDMRLYVQKDEKLEWQSLFKDDRCEGGRSAENTLEIFSLKRKSAFVDIWLEMRDGDAEDGAVDPNDIKKTPYRYTRVFFGRKPGKDVPLKLQASMTPSSGFASVFFTPADPDFDFILPRGGVRLDFDDMEPKLKSDLPEARRSYPRNGWRELAEWVDFDDRVRTQLYWALRNEEHNKIKEALCRSKRDGRSPTGTIHAVNEKGEQKVFDQKLFEKVLRLIDEKIQTSEEWINPASWLWGACPERARKEIFNYLKGNQRKVDRIGYAVRVSKTEDDFRAIFLETDGYIKKKKIFPSTLAKNLIWLLDYRPDASKVLNKEKCLRDCRKTLLDALKDSLDAERLQNINPQSFQWLPGLFAVLLRQREFDSGFLKDPDDISTWSNWLGTLSDTLDKRSKSNNGLFSKYNQRLLLQRDKYGLNYYEQIENWLKCSGNDVPVLSDEL